MLTLELGGILLLSICFYFDQQWTSFWLAFEKGLTSVSICFVAAFSCSICRLLTISSWRLSIANAIDSFFHKAIFYYHQYDSFSYYLFQPCWKFSSVSHFYRCYNRWLRIGNC